MSTSSTQRSTSTTQGTTQGSATTQDRASSLWNLGLGGINSDGAFTGDLTAGLTPDQLAAFGMIRNSTGAGLPQLNAASTAAQAATGFQPGMVGTPGAQPIAQAGGGGVDIGAIIAQLQASGGIASAGPAASARDVTAPDLSSVDLTKYTNPYQQQVIDASLAAINQTQGQEVARQAGVQAKGGAFGDSRSGVESALTAQLFDRNKQATVADLNTKNFLNAQAVGQSDLMRQLEAARSNQGADVSTSVANLGAGTQANIANAGNLTGVVSNAANTNANLAADTSKFNAGQTNSGNQFNADLATRIAQGNQAADLTGNAQRISGASTLGNLGMAVQTQGLNAANALGAAGAVAQGTNQAGLTNELNNFLRNQGYDQQQIQNLLSIFQQTAPASGMRTTQNTAGTQTTPGSLIPSLVGGGLSLLGGLPAIGAKLGISAATK